VQPFQRPGDIQLYAAEAGRLHLAAGSDQIEQHRYASFRHAEMVDAKLRKLAQLSDVRFERGGIRVDFRMPARD
jgi:hypothetical protein